MQISSPAFTDNDQVPLDNTCLGPNMSPSLVFSGVPADAKSLVLLVEDADAAPQPWVHWLVFNIPATNQDVAAGTVPFDGTEGHANGGTTGYEGPCPKYFSGTHHYEFKLYALDCKLNLPRTADKSQVAPAMEGHVIAEALLTGLCTAELYTEQLKDA